MFIVTSYNTILQIPQTSIIGVLVFLYSNQLQPTLWKLQRTPFNLSQKQTLNIHIHHISSLFFC